MKAAIYVRVSTEEQARGGISPEVQKKMCQDYCINKGFEIFKIYDDSGISGKNLKRPAFNQMLKDAENQKYNILIFYSLSRLSRSLIDTINTLNKFKEYSVDFVSVTEQNIDTTTPHGKVMLNIIATMNELERDNIVKRTKDALYYKLTQGEHITRPPFGYKAFTTKEGKKTLQINEKQATAIKSMFKDRLEGAKLENLSKKYKKTKLFVSRILSNPKYIGYNHYQGKEFFKNTIPPIIDEDVFLKINPKYYVEKGQLKIKEKPKKEIKQEKNNELDEILALGL